MSEASRKLSLSQPTISAQIKTLENHIGAQLFNRHSRQLSLTETGVLTLRYADEIFSLGRELRQALTNEAINKPKRLHIGIADVLPKIMCRRLLEPALTMVPTTHLICEEGKTERLLADLSIRRLDLVLSDSPIGAPMRVRAFNHFLGDSGITFFASPNLALAHGTDFPSNLDGAPILLPTSDTILRRNLQHYFDEHEVRPRIVAEFHDSALLKVFGSAGHGIFAAATVIEKEVQANHSVHVIGRTSNVKESFYAITAERRVTHPAVLTITESAKKIFSSINF